MGACFASSVVGYYAFGRSLLALPMGILASSVAQVFYPEGAREWDETGSVSTTIHKSVRILSLACVFPMVAVGMLGPLLFDTALGSRWHEAGVYAQIMTPWVLIALIASPLSTVFLIRQRAGSLLLFNIVSLIGRSGALLLGGLAGGPRIALMAFSAIGALVYLYLLAAAVRLGRTARRRVASELLREASRAFVLLLPAAFAYWVGRSAWMSLALLCAAAVSHCVWVCRREPLARSKVRSIFSRLHPGGPTEVTAS